MDNSDENPCKVFNVIKSESDQREYKYILLPNKAKLLLISDETTEKAAASVDINVGHFLDPDEVPGIAHFCEHMLFLGTSKYPVENDFMQFLSQNGGRSNACTGSEHTNYHFDVKHEALSEAIDRFAQFFICPLFDADSTDRELNAIESEFQKNILNDSRRLHFIDKRTSRPDHVCHKFGTGNLETLKTIPVENNIDIRDLLLKFHKKYYSANVMTVVVLGKESLEELERIVVPLFSQIVNKNVMVPSYEEHPYGEDQLQTLTEVVPVKEIKRLKLVFPLPDIQQHYKLKPCHYLSHLIGHEGEGSLLSLLKNKNWVNELVAGAASGAKGYSSFDIGMELSEEGLNHVDEIISSVFQYIKLLKEAGPDQLLFQEMKMLDEMMFRFKDKAQPQYYVMGISQDMHYYEPEDTLYGNYRIDTFAPDLITKFLQLLKPSTFRMFVLSQDFKEKADLSVQYYNAKYSLSKISSDKIEEWENMDLHPDLHLPRKNIFIPESLDIKIPKVASEEENVPSIIRDSQMMRVWYKPDDSFYLPKSCLYLTISCPLAHITPLHTNQLSIYISLLKDDLTEYAYDANLAGVSYSVHSISTGILIKLSGYNDKQLVLLKEILKKMTSLTVKSERFVITKQKLEESLRNIEANQPYMQIGRMANWLMNERGWNPEEQLNSLSDVTAETLALYLSQLFKYMYVECLFIGNLLLNEANEISDCVQQILIEDIQSQPMLAIQHMLSREHRLPNGCSYLFEKRNTIHDLSCIQVYLQVGLQEMRDNVLLELFSEMLRVPCFDNLRTKEQLGYIVFSGISRSVSVQGLRVLIQSDKLPSLVEDKIDAFLGLFKENLQNMSDEEFKDYVSGLEVRKLEKPKKLSHEAGRHWGEILIKQYHFKRSKVEVKELHKLTKQDIVEFYDKYISPSSNERKKIVTVILGKETDSMLQSETKEHTKWTVVDDVLKFKSSLSLYPLVQPFNDVPLLAATKSKL